MKTNNRRRRRRRNIFLMLLLLTEVFLIGYIINGDTTTDIEVVETPTTVVKPIAITNEFTDGKETKRFDSSIRRALNRWQIKGATIAVMRNNKLVYLKGFGHSDVELDIESKPSDLYRIASMSKLFTGAAIMKLVDAGIIKLDDKVFGEGGILGTKYLDLRDKRVEDITVEHLLRHEAGFTTPMGDPMFKIELIEIGLEMKRPVTTRNAIEFQLSRRLGYTPGRSKSYSNVGYVVLSDIISKVSGESYENYVTKEILMPIGCYDTHIANNFYKDRYTDEVKYYSGSKDDFLPSYTGSGEIMPKAYGGNDVRGLQGAGAWVSTASDMLKFAMSIDGKIGQEEVNDILSAGSILEMTTYIKDRSPIGWASVQKGVLERTGSFCGTTTIMNHNPNGTSWIILTNTSSYIGYRLNNNLKSMMRSAMPLLPMYDSDRDLFDLDYLKLVSTEIDGKKANQLSTIDKV